LLSAINRNTKSTEAFVNATESYTKFISPVTVTKDKMKASRSMCRGFVNIFGHFAAVVDNGRMPNGESIAESASQNARAFTSTAALRPVGSIIFEMAMNQDAVAGFGPRTLNPELQAGLERLSECRNDLKSAFVAGMCGYWRVSRGDTTDSVRESAHRP
jgi:hypothetical protein